MSYRIMFVYEDGPHGKEVVEDDIKTHAYALYLLREYQTAAPAGCSYQLERVLGNKPVSADSE